MENIEEYKKYVYLASSFYNENKLPQNVNDKRNYIFENNKNALKNLLNLDYEKLPKDPTHTEALALLHLFGGFDEKIKNKLDPNCSTEKITELLKEIVRQESIKENKPIEIIGNILLVATLNDPCADFCMPMFDKFKDRLGNILVSIIKKDKKDKIIKVSNNLENIVLIGGVQPYLQSRDTIKEVDSDDIYMFKDHKNMIYSADFSKSDESKNVKKTKRIESSKESSRILPEKKKTKKGREKNK